MAERQDLEERMREGLRKTIDYFASLDLSRFRKPTPHTAHGPAK